MLQPPRGAPRARGRGRGNPWGGLQAERRAGGPVQPESAETCEAEEKEEITVEPLPDDAEIHHREEDYQELRRVIGIGSEADGDTTPAGFSPDTLDTLQALWTPLSAGELLSRIGHFLRIVRQMMDEVGYMTERHREQAQPKPHARQKNDSSRGVTGNRCRGGELDQEGQGPQQGEAPFSSSNMPPNSSAVGERNTRHDPVPREEHLTDEDWAIMAAVENCKVWRMLKALSLKQREKLLAAICMTLQETVEGNPQRGTVGCPDDFRDWGRRWVTDEMEALLVM